MLTRAARAKATKNEANTTALTKKEKAAKARYEKARRRGWSLVKKSKEADFMCGLKVLLAVQDEKNTRIYNSKPEHEEFSALLRLWISSPSGPEAGSDESGAVQVWPNVVGRQTRKHARQRYETSKQRGHASSTITAQAVGRRLRRPGSQIAPFKTAAFMRAKEWFQRFPYVAGLVSEDVFSIV